MLRRYTNHEDTAERGQIIVLFALVFVLICVFGALVIDAGLLRNDRQRLANALDAGALAGASMLPVDGSVSGWEAILDEIEDRISATFPGLVRGTDYTVSFRCLIGIDDNDRAATSRDIPTVCSPHGALGIARSATPNPDDFIGAGPTRSSVCDPALDDVCNVVEIRGAVDTNFFLAPVIGIDEGNTGTVVSAACNGPCGEAPAVPIDVVLIIDRTGSMAGDENNLRNGARAVLEAYDPAIQHVALGMLGPSTLNDTCGGSGASGVHGEPLEWQAPSAPVFREAETDRNQSDSNGATTLRIDRPGGSNLNGQLLVAGITLDGGSSVGVTPPSGWTLIQRTNNSTRVAVLSYYKVAGSSEPSTYTWSFNTSARAAGGIMRFTGVNTSDPIDAAPTGNTGNGSTLTAPSFNAAATTTLVGMFAIDENVSFSAGSGMTERFEEDHQHNDEGPSIQASTRTHGGGSTGNRTASANESDQWAAHMFSLNSANSSPEYGTDTRSVLNGGDREEWIPVGLTGEGAGAHITDSYLTASGDVDINSQIGKAIACFDLSGTGTNLATPLDMAVAYLAEHGRGGDVRKGIIFESDGTPNHNNTPDPQNYTCSAAIAAAQRAKDAGIEIFTIGYGGIATERCPDNSGPYNGDRVREVLAAMASNTVGPGTQCNGAENGDGDHFFCLPSGEDLSVVFQAAAIELADVKPRLVHVYPIPLVTAIAPNGGGSGGGTIVTITGRYFTGVTNVTFGGADATILTTSETMLTVRAPAGSAGETVEVHVRTPGGVSPATPAANFTYSP